jgi:glycosyltransferase involved in cell wall biosynthesis
MAPHSADGVMRIVAHNGARIWGGAERATVSLLQGLAARGHEVLLLCNDDRVASEAASRGVPSQICVIGGDIMLHHAIRLSRILNESKPDAFIVGTYKKLFLATLGARLAHVPRIVARIGLESDTPRSIKYRIALRRWTDAVAVNASRIVAPFTQLDGFGPEKVQLIWNSIPAQYDNEESRGLRNEFGIASDEFVIGIVARLAKQKRIDRLVRVVSMLPDVKCIIAGDGPARGELELLSAELGVQDRVHFVGNREDVSHVLDSLDVFVLVSDSEGMSNAMLEAMARGRAVVSTNVSGADDALAASDNHGAAGIITDFDEASIAHAVEVLRNDAELRQSLGRAARNRARSQFSRDAMLTAWEDFLEARAR